MFGEDIDYLNMGLWGFAVQRGIVTAVQVWASVGHSWQTAGQAQEKSVA